MRKKAQEEIVGFVLIVVIVAVIFIIFLGILIKKNSSTDETDSEEVSQFLDSIMDYSVKECSSSYSYTSLREIIIKCHNGETCPNSNVKSCDVLKETLENLINSGWHFGFESAEQGYIAEIIKPDGKLEFIPLSNNKCDPQFRIGSQREIHTKDGSVVISLKICLNPS